MQEEIKNIANEIINKYCEIRNIDKLPEVSVEIVEDLYSECVQKSADAVKEDLKAQKEWMQTLNGTIVFPECYTEPFGILIKKSYIEECIRNNNCNWIGTLCHELTHVIDYVNAMEYTANYKMEDFIKARCYEAFAYWTEFNARRYGHYLLRCYEHGEFLKSTIALNDLINREIPYQMQLWAEGFGEGKNASDAMYSTMQFLGRLKVWKDLFPDCFDENMLGQIFEPNEWIKELFSYLEESDTVEKLLNSFEVMERIFQ